MQAEPIDTLERKLAEFTPKQRKLILRNTYAMQLTEGCSMGCVDCGSGALAGIRGYIPFDILEKLFKENKKDLVNLNILYFASDPFDYNFEGKDYADVHKSFMEIVGGSLEVTTAVPKGSERKVLDLIMGDNSISYGEGKQRKFISTLSIMKSNFPRLEKAFSEMGGYRTNDQLQTQQYRLTDKDVAEVTDPLIIEKIEKPEVSIFGENKGQTLYIVKSNNCNVGSLGDPVTFHDILKYLKGRKELARFWHDNMGFPDREMDISNFYEMNLPSGQLHAYRLGEKFKNNLSQENISCAHGIVLKPSGIFNTQSVKTSPEYPLGLIQTEVTPENFQVIPFVHIVDYSFKRGNLFLSLGHRRLKRKNLFADALNRTNLYWQVKSLIS